MNKNHFKITLYTEKGQSEDLIVAESIEIGRDVSADFPIMASGVSRSHLKIFVEDGEIKLKDLGSTNGTFLRGDRLEPNKKTSYENGERLSLGQAGCFVRVELADIKEEACENLSNQKEEPLDLEKKRDLASAEAISADQKLETAQAAHSKLILENEDLNEQIEDLSFEHKQKKLEFESIRLEVEKLLQEKEGLESQILETRKAEELRLREYKKQVESNAEEVLINARRSADELLIETEIEKKESLEEINKKLEDAQVKAEQIEKRAVEKEKDLMESAERLYEEAVEEKLTILKKAESKRDEIVGRAKSSEKKLLKEVEKIKETAVSEKKEILESAKKEKELFLKESRSRLEQADLDYAEKMNDFNQYRRTKKEELKKEIEEEKRILEAGSPGFEDNANEKNLDEESEVKNLIKIKTQNKEKNKKREVFKKAVAFTVVGLFILTLAPYVINKSIMSKTKPIAKDHKKLSKRSPANDTDKK